MLNNFDEIFQAYKEHQLNLKDRNPLHYNLKFSKDEIYSNICILGGGSAGYLTALALKKHFKIDVTIIDSSKGAPIGVGESTTPIIKSFLFKQLGFDRKEFYEQVKPSWKLGIKFDWGLPGDYHFNYSFEWGDLLSSYKFNQTINNSSFNSLLMEKDLSFIFQKQNGSYHSLSPYIRYALHLDNKLFLEYLKKKSIEEGIKILDETVIDAVSDEKDEILYLLTEDNIKLEYDFYVDCSGFKSVLLENKLGSKYIDYRDSLINDQAIVGITKNKGIIKPYTSAITLKNGWCWNIPVREEDHIGYVFSSKFTNSNDALNEIRSLYPNFEETKKIHFKTGRHEEFIKGNVAAIGNSYGFIEPLESTGLHMIIQQINLLLNNFFHLKGNPKMKTMINKNVGDHWDYVKWFIAIHFKFNQKLDSEYWKFSREFVDTTSFDFLTDLYKEVGLLSKQTHSVTEQIKSYIKDPIFDLIDIDIIHLGQGILPGNMKNLQLDNKKDWDSKQYTWNELLRFAIPIDKDIDFLVNEPELIF